MYVIFGRDNCPWCDRAKALLISKDLPFIYRDTRNNEVFNDMHDWVSAQTGNAPKTVPQIFVENEEKHLTYIGGFDSLYESFELKESVTADDFDLELL